MKLTLFDINSDLCRAFATEFSPYQNVTVICTELTKLEPHDILVTAGNGLGLMGGGIDYYVNKLCKFKAEQPVREAIQQSYWGELPVGKFVTVDIDKMTKGQFKVLVYAPTMERPGQLISEKEIYKVFYSIISAYKDIDCTLACPGLGTLTGGISLSVAARTMKKAYSDVTKGVIQ